MCHIGLSGIFFTFVSIQILVTQYITASVLLYCRKYPSLCYDKDQRFSGILHGEPPHTENMDIQDFFPNSLIFYTYPGSFRNAEFVVMSASYTYQPFPPSFLFQALKQKLTFIPCQSREESQKLTDQKQLPTFFIHPVTVFIVYVLLNMHL